MTASTENAPKGTPTEGTTMTTTEHDGLTTALRTSARRALRIAWSRRPLDLRSAVLRGLAAAAAGAVTAAVVYLASEQLRAATVAGAVVYVGAFTAAIVTEIRRALAQQTLDAIRRRHPEVFRAVQMEADYTRDAEMISADTGDQAALEAQDRRILDAITDRGVMRA